MMNERGLLDLKKKIGESKTRVDELRGQKDLLMKELGSEWNCNSVKEATAHLQELEESQEKIESQIDDGLEKIEKAR